MNAIDIISLKKYFGKTKAVDGISFQVEQGEIFGFLGPNGAGKTTTIRCMMDFVRPTDGAINLLGMNSLRDSVQLKSRIGYLSGGVRLHDKWTGQDHIDYVRSLKKNKDSTDKLAKSLNFDASVKTRRLSLGNRQKLGLILSMIGEPELLLLDEPALGLDPLLQDSVYELLMETNAKGTTIFMSSHNLSEVERICHRVGIIKNGKMVAVEDVMNLKQKRMYKVFVSFAGEFNKKDFAIDSVQIVKAASKGLTMDIRGDINPIVSLLNKYELIDLQISHASLKDIFMEYYEK